MHKVAIVTGASKGIGAATAKLLAQNGYAVCVNYKNSQDQAEAVVNEILQHKGQAIAVYADMGIERDVLNLFATVDQQLGTVSILVNNAGMNGGACEVENLDMQVLYSVFATNVYGTFLASREAVKRMKTIGGGNIINITSEAANFGGTKMTSYASSKAAINTFTKGLSREVAIHNIRVNAVSPGVIDTEIHQGSSPERIANLLKSLPMGRMGTPNEVAELICWLSSDKASYISGAILPVTGSR